MNCCDAGRPEVRGPGLVIETQATAALLLWENLRPLLREGPSCCVAPGATALKQAGVWRLIGLGLSGGHGWLGKQRPDQFLLQFSNLCAMTPCVSLPRKLRLSAWRNTEAITCSRASNLGDVLSVALHEMIHKILTAAQY